MNDTVLTELKAIVERAVRPVQATMARKRKMGEELLAHLVSIFEEEARRGDGQTAIERARERFGDPERLSGQLQESVPYWDRYRPGLWMVVAAYALFYPVLLAVASFFSDWDLGGLRVIVVFTLTWSFVSVLGIWASLGLGSVWRRLMWIVGGLLYCDVMIARAVALTRRDFILSDRALLSAVSFLINFSVPLIGAAVALFIARCCGARLVLFDEISLEQRSKPFQFSLRSLMGLTVVVAILLATVRSVRINPDFSSYWFIARCYFGLGFWVILAATAAVWAALGQRWTLLRIVVVTLAAMCFGVVLPSGASKGFVLSCLMIAPLHVLGIVLPLLVVRSYGYRFVHLPKGTQEQVAGEIAVE